MSGIKKKLTEDGWVIDDFHGKGVKDLKPSDVEKLIKKGNKIAEELQKAKMTIKDLEGDVYAAGTIANNLGEGLEKLTSFISQTYPEEVGENNLFNNGESVVDVAIRLLTPEAPAK